MKKLFFISVSLLGLVLSSCNSTPAPKPEVVDGYIVGSTVETEIISSYNLTREDDFVTVHQLDNGQEVFVYSDKVYLNDTDGERIPWEGKFTDALRGYRDAMVEKWNRARTGLKVKMYLSQDGEIIEMLPINPNYTKNRVVTKVTKYDGHMSQIDGKMKGYFLAGSSGSLHGESCGGEDFFINVYFNDGEPLYVNAKEDRKWLDVEPGDTVVEKVFNGLMSYQIKAK